ncbi:PAN domain-containing protein [Jeongeupia naejangsanensis]|uniref:Alkaline phosphatase family protein n=1 Tax=Jeongeupia naejangsanensis TaxID=613195 RepID=A0ABS2BIR6_9NEIS|nr:PAN domain-containing protein [Jeongeupia naejangsanensis]MBM3114861.1 alkaline phosphatase family protein [Jeongeupia naejangsanensis]
MKQLALALCTVLVSAFASAAALESFDFTANAAISGNNTEHLTQVTPEQCAASCLGTSRANWCVSFDYYKNTQECDLSNKRAADVGGLKTNYAGNPYDHYSIKDVLRAFTFTANAAIAGYNTERLTGVSPAACASACLDGSRSNWCRSFDYNRTTQECDLSDKRARDTGGLKTDYSGNPYDHYSWAPVDGVPNPLPGNKHVLLIGIDGLRGDAIGCSGCVATPALSALIQGGAVHHNLLAGGSQATVSGPGWATNFTGFWADQHGVTSNDITQPLLKPHVFDQIKQAYPTATTAVVADWANLTHNLLPKQADYVVSNEAKNSQQATDAVKRWLAMSNAPTAIFYYLHNVDIHATSYDPLNANYQSKIAGEDAQIQQVLNALAARPNYANEEWLIVVASDHGGINSSHGGQTAQERDAILILNSTWQKNGKTPYCSGDLSAVTLTQVNGVTPHVLDLLGLPNVTAGQKYAGCGH